MAEDDFRALVGDGVEPIKSQAKVNVVKQRRDEALLRSRRQAAETSSEPLEDPLAGEPPQMQRPDGLLAFKRSGVQHGVFKKMRLGKYSLDARLDLHKLTVEQARQEVFQFVKDCVANDIRTALITHGKGEGRQRQAVLKTYVAFWLPQLEPVLAFHSAQKHHGGSGATYVLLKKSESAKLKNKQRHEKS